MLRNQLQRVAWASPGGTPDLLGSLSMLTCISTLSGSPVRNRFSRLATLIGVHGVDPVETGGDVFAFPALYVADEMPDQVTVIAANFASFC